MFKYMAAAAAALALTVSASAANAVVFDGSFGVDYNTDPGAWGGLVINVTPATGNVNFNLNAVNDTTGWQKLFTISSPEGSMDLDDLWNWEPIEVTFTFDTPTGLGGDIGGETGGTAEFKGLFKGWDHYGNVIWDGPETWGFGDTGKLRVQLSKANFELGSSADVYAKFTLEGLPSAVPEPATWAMMITGFGLAGTAIRRRRSTFAVAA